MRLEKIGFWSGEARKSSQLMPSRFNTNINISKASASKDKLSVEFQHQVSYEPDGSMLVLGGSALFGSKNAKKCADEWAKTKRIAGADGEAIINAINYNATAHMVLFARLFDLIPPLSMPVLRFEEKSPKRKSP